MLFFKLKRLAILTFSTFLIIPTFLTSNISVQAAEEENPIHTFDNETEALLEAQQNIGIPYLVEESENSSYEIIYDTEDEANANEEVTGEELIIEDEVTGNTATDDDLIMTPFVNIPDGPVYTWDYVATYNFNNRMDNLLISQVYQWLIKGYGYSITRYIPEARTRTLANGLIAQVAKKVVPKQATAYWTIKKYKDEDKYNVYVKQVIKVYSNSAKTKLAHSTFVIEKYAK